MSHLNSKQESFHLFKRSWKEFHFYGEIVLESGQDERAILSHFLFSIPCNIGRGGRIDKRERQFELWQQATWLCRFTK
jgi:hypothetical protein